VPFDASFLCDEIDSHCPPPCVLLCLLAIKSPSSVEHILFVSSYEIFMEVVKVRAEYCSKMKHNMQRQGTELENYSFEAAEHLMRTHLIIQISKGLKF